MRWLKFVLSHSIFISFCAVALCFKTGLLLHLPINYWLYCFVFFSTLFSYNIYWLASKIFLNKLVFNFSVIKKERIEFSLLFIYAIGLVLSFFKSNINVGFLIFPCLLNALYFVPLLPFNFFKFTKNLGILKTTILAFTWMYVTAYLPIQKSFFYLSKIELLLLVNRFFFMLLLCIIFDSRDIAMDKIRGLHSMATDIKPSILKWISIVMLASLFVFNFYMGVLGVNQKHVIALQISALSLIVFYFLSLKKQGYFFYYFFVDGLMLFSAIATFITTIS